MRVPEWIKNLLSCFSIKSSIPWIALITGLALAYFGFSDIMYISEKAKHICIWFSNTLIVGAVVGFMSSYAQFRGLFRKDLESVIYDEKFLSLRKDLLKNWKKITSIFFESRFPEISDDLMSAIVNHYLSIKSISFYCDDFQDITTVEWFDREKKILNVITESTFNVIAPSVEAIKFPYSASVCVEGDHHDEYKVEVIEYKVNEKDIDYKVSKKEIGKVLSVTVDIQLSGAKKYSIHRKILKRYSIEHDYFIGFKAKSIINNLRVQFFNEIYEDLDICFIPRGTLKEFKNTKNRHDYLEKEYKGLILRNQGFIIVLKNK